MMEYYSAIKKTTNIHNSMDKPQKHTEQKKPGMKQYYCLIPFT